MTKLHGLTHGDTFNPVINQEVPDVMLIFISRFIDELKRAVYVSKHSFDVQLLQLSALLGWVTLMTMTGHALIHIQDS